MTGSKAPPSSILRDRNVPRLAPHALEPRADRGEASEIESARRFLLGRWLERRALARARGLIAISEYKTRPPSVASIRLPPTS
jgi:hypothetical protein